MVEQRRQFLERGPLQQLRTFWMMEAIDYLLLTLGANWRRQRSVDIQLLLQIIERKIYSTHELMQFSPLYFLILAQVFQVLVYDMISCIAILKQTYWCGLGSCVIVLDWISLTFLEQVLWIFGYSLEFHMKGFDVNWIWMNSNRNPLQSSELIELSIDYQLIELIYWMLYFSSIWHQRAFIEPKPFDHSVSFAHWFMTLFEFWSHLIRLDYLYTTLTSYLALESWFSIQLHSLL